MDACARGIKAHKRARETILTSFMADRAMLLRASLHQAHEDDQQLKEWAKSDSYDENEKSFDEMTKIGAAAR